MLLDPRAHDPDLVVFAMIIAQEQSAKSGHPPNTRASDGKDLPVVFRDGERAEKVMPQLPLR